MSEKFPIELDLDNDKLSAAIEAENNRDAGSMARERVKGSAKRSMLKALLSLFLIANVVLGAIGGFLYYKWDTRTVKGYHYERSCTIPGESKVVVEGKRKYFNQSETFMGFRLVNADAARETTTLMSTHLETTVIGINGNGEWWSIHNPAAEPRHLQLKEAETYIFVQEGKTAVVSYEQFCK